MYIIRSYIRNTLKFAGLLTITLHYQFHTAGMYTVESLQVVIKTDITYMSGHYVDIWNSSIDNSGVIYIYIHTGSGSVYRYVYGQ